MNIPEFTQGGERVDIDRHREQIEVVEIFNTRAREIEDLINTSLATTEDIQRYKSELGRLCPYTDREVICSGAAVIPLTNDEGVQVGDTSATLESLQGWHVGPRIVTISSGEDNLTRFAVTHAVVAGSSEDFPYATRAEFIDTYAYMHLGGSIVMLDKLKPEATAYDSTDSEIKETLKSLSEEHQSIVYSKKFKDLKRKKQERKISSFIYDANKIVGLTGANVKLMGNTAYFLYLDDDGDHAVHIGNIDGKILSGQCLGVDSFEAAVADKYRIRNPRNNIPRSLAGLAIVLDLHPTSKKLVVPEGIDTSITFVPFRPNQFDMELVKANE